MENIIVTNLENGYIRLRPADGYKLYSAALDRFVSEAVVKEKDAGRFSAVAV